MDSVVSTLSKVPGFRTPLHPEQLVYTCHLTHKSFIWFCGTFGHEITLLLNSFKGCFINSLTKFFRSLLGDLSGIVDLKTSLISVVKEKHCIRVYSVLD